MTTRWVPSGDPASEFTRTGLRSGKYWTRPAWAARTTYPIVAAFLKLGMPTMMSARSSLAISSRMAGGRTGPATSAPADLGDGPVGVRAAWCVAAVGGLDRH